MVRICLVHRQGVFPRALTVTQISRVRISGPQVWGDVQQIQENMPTPSRRKHSIRPIMPIRDADYLRPPVRPRCFSVSSSGPSFHSPLIQKFLLAARISLGPAYAMASPCPADGALTARLSCAASVLLENKSEYLGPVLEQGYVLVWIAICTVIVHWIVKKVTPPENDAESWDGFVKSTYGDDRDQFGKT